MTGRVQGVGFRYFTRCQARKYRLSGWVQNQLDGSVLVQAEGPEDEVAGLLDWLRKGPPLAEVNDIKIKKCRPEGLKDFRIRKIGFVKTH